MDASGPARAVWQRWPGWRVGAAVLGACLVLARWTTPVGGQELDDGPLQPLAVKLVGTRWALIQPERDYQGGCDVGFLAFRFIADGYFIYNNRLVGTWRVDNAGTLKLRTRAGVQLTLSVDGDTMRPLQNYPLPFMRRLNVYQRCPEE